MGSITTPHVSETRLFKPLAVGHNKLEHRIVFAPLTRLRNDDDHVPLPFMEIYYGDRASAPGTLMISEATGISHTEEGMRNGPGLVTDLQVEAWGKIIDAVHAKGSFFFQQIWAMGRASTPDYLAERGLPYRSSSAQALPGSDVTPTAMTEDDIQETIQGFIDTAKRAMAAGADGVEIHSAHGYLLDQFLSDSVNKRTDKWGGSIENRSRLTLEVIKAVVDTIGAERVAFRFSPYAGFQGSEKPDAHELFTYLIEQLKQMNVKFAYMSLVEAAGDPGALIFGGDHPNTGKKLDFMLEAWNNLSPVIVAGAYTAETAALALEHHYSKWDVLVAFGRHFLANPDLVFRFKNELELNPYNRATFYTNKAEEGYNDYPFSEKYLKQHPTTRKVLVN
ncbi:hypothetical protein G7046_g3975 [Stylonectria norvegica]|nr:hypothetical protein G7046_g3975 [Stylonectria norvegica]